MVQSRVSPLFKENLKKYFMKVTNFEVGVGKHSEVASRVLYNAAQKKWTGMDLAFYYHSIFKMLAAGADVENAILETEHILITTNVTE